MAILLAGTWAYATSFRGVFVLDDVRAIVRNETIRSVWPLAGPLRPPPRSTVAGRPIANLSFAVNYVLAPESLAGSAAGAPPGSAAVDPRPFHAGNLIIHLAAALALFGVLRLTLASPRLAATYGEAAPWLALAATLVWTVHPLQTSAVTYVVQRVESLMGLLYLSTLYCSIRAFNATRQGRWAAAAIVSCALGMATKEVMVTAPLAVAAWWWLFVRADAGAPRRRDLALLAGLGVTWLILAFLVFGERRGPSLVLGWDASRAYLLAQAEIIVHYLRLAVVPSPLVFLYDWPLGTSLSAVAWQAALLALLAGLTAAGLARRQPASYAGVWFFLILAPSSSVLPIVTEVAAEHRMYLPLAAVVAAVVISGFLLGRRLLRPAKAAPLAATVALVACVGLLAHETRERNRMYWSAAGLWGDTVAKRPGDARPRVAYAEALAEAGRLAEAQAQLEAGLALAPTDPAAHIRMGAVLAQQGQFDSAVSHLERALDLRPGDIDAHRFLGEIYAARRQDALAAKHFEDALAAAPGDPRLMGRLAALLAGSGDPLVRNVARARDLARRAVRLTGGRDPRLEEILSAVEAAR